MLKKTRRVIDENTGEVLQEWNEDGILVYQADVEENVTPECKWDEHYYTSFRLMPDDVPIFSCQRCGKIVVTGR